MNDTNTSSTSFNNVVTGLPKKFSPRQARLMKLQFEN